jgi:hypothetical protein
VAVGAVDQFGDGGGLVALRLQFALDLEPQPAFGFVRAGRTMRDPGLFGEFRASGAQQIFQRGIGRGCAGDAAAEIDLVRILFAALADAGTGQRRILVDVEPELLRQRRIEA